MLVRYNCYVGRFHLRSIFLEDNTKTSNSCIRYRAGSVFRWAELVCVFLRDSQYMAVIHAHKQASAIKTLRDNLENTDPELAALIAEADSLCMLRRISPEEKYPLSVIAVSQIDCHGVLVRVGSRVYVVPAPYLRTRV